MTTNGSVRRKRVAIIGGGVSGLAAARAFARRGHDVIGFERSDTLGGVWDPSRSYPGVRTQSPKDLYRYTDQAMPGACDEWPTGADVHDYLGAWADRHGLRDRFRLGATVVSAERASTGWTLTVDTPGDRLVEAFDFVAVCTGQFSTKRDVVHPGREAFEARGGRVLHSSEFTDPAAVEGRRVVVLGGSKSATDVAVEAARHGASAVTLVYPRNVWRVPRFVGGINFKRLLYMRAQEAQFEPWERGPAARAVAALSRPLVWANFRGLETLLKAQLGLRKRGMVPDTRIEDDVSCALSIVTPGFLEGLDDGSIRAVRGAVESYGDDGVVLADGERVGCDSVVLAVGWTLELPWLPAPFRRSLVDEDGQYRLHRHAVNPDVPDMGFVGFNSSFCTLLSSELVAEWLVRHADGRLARPADETTAREGIERTLVWRREVRPVARIYGGLCVAPFHFRHFDELLADIGAGRRRRRNALAEWFSYPNAEAFGEFLGSAPEYRATGPAA